MRFFSRDLVLFLLLILIGVTSTLGLEGRFDVLFHDETSYLREGVEFFERYPYRLKAPLYAFWYYLLTLVESDALARYYLNFRLVTLLMGLLIFAVLRTYKVTQAVAFVVGVLVIVNPLFEQVWPKVNHFSICLLLFGLMVNRFVSNPNLKILQLLFVLTFVSYVRAEYFLGAVLLFLFLIYHLCFADSARPRGIYIVSYALPLLALLYLFGSPERDDARKMVAFSQHYAFNDHQWNQSGEFVWADSGMIVRRDFGPVDTPLDALKSNPRAILKHIARNVWNFGTVHAGYARSLLRLFPHTLPFVSLALLICAAFFWRVIFLFKNKRQAVATELEILGSPVVVLSLFFPSLVSILFLYPQGHYLMNVWILTAFFILVRYAAIFNEVFPLKNRRHAGILCFGIVLSFSFFFYARSSTEPRQFSNQRAIHYIRALHIQKPVELLEAQGGIHTYLAANYRWHPQYRKSVGEDFYEYLRSRKINMILFSPGLQRDRRFVNDVGWAAFREDFEKDGFKVMKVPETDFLLYVHEGLLL